MKRSIVKCNINFLWRRHFSICSRLLDRKSYIGVAQIQPEAGARPPYIPLGAKSWWTQSREWGSLRWIPGMWVVGGIPHPTDPPTVCDVCQEPRYVWDWAWRLSDQNLSETFHALFWSVSYFMKHVLLVFMLAFFSFWTVLRTNLPEHGVINRSWADLFLLKHY